MAQKGPHQGITGPSPLFLARFFFSEGGAKLLLKEDGSGAGAPCSRVCKGGFGTRPPPSLRACRPGTLSDHLLNLNHTDVINTF